MARGADKLLARLLLQAFKHAFAEDKRHSKQPIQHAPHRPTEDLWDVAEPIMVAVGVALLFLYEKARQVVRSIRDASSAR